jgi:hypothetical protein
LPVVPQPRGPLTEQLFDALLRAPGALAVPSVDANDPLTDDDFQLALYAAYELHYRGYDGVDEDWEWQPSLIAFRRQLEQVFERALLERVPRVGGIDLAPEEMDLALREIEASDDGPSLSRYVERDAGLDQVLEFLIHRSAYQLKEADPHSWALPRLSGPPKAAMVEIQADEYGGGRADRVHAQLFADTLEAMDLDATYGAYIDRLPGVTCATVNLMSLCGLNRRLRGAIVGHLALFEMTSSIPNRRYGDGLRRLGYGKAATEFFDEHVVADAVHENIAAVDLAGGLVRMEPELAGDILWGARALIDVDARWGGYVLGAWEAGESSLRPLSSSPLGALKPSSL